MILANYNRVKPVLVLDKALGNGPTACTGAGLGIMAKLTTVTANLHQMHQRCVSS